MYSYYKLLRHAITNHQTGDARKLLLKDLSPEYIACLLRKRESLLDLAASGSQSEIMALLIQKGITKWLGGEENNRVFIRLIEDYQADPRDSQKPTDREKKQRIDVLELKEDPEKVTTAIRYLLKFQKRWLVSILRQTALVRTTTKMVTDNMSWSMLNHKSVVYEAVTGKKLERETETVGSNISWFIEDGVSAAYDSVTGRKLRGNQTMFAKPVELLMCSESETKEWTVNLEGTTREVLEKIYIEYEPLFEELGDCLWFEGLREIKRGTYILDLGS